MINTWLLHISDFPQIRMSSVCTWHKSSMHLQSQSQIQPLKIDTYICMYIWNEVFFLDYFLLIPWSGQGLIWNRIIDMKTSALTNDNIRFAFKIKCLISKIIFCLRKIRQFSKLFNSIHRTNNAEKDQVHLINICNCYHVSYLKKV